MEIPWCWRRHDQHKLKPDRPGHRKLHASQPWPEAQGCQFVDRKQQRPHLILRVGLQDQEGRSVPSPILRTGLEHQLEGKLDLARRARVASWRTRAGDDAKRGAARSRGQVRIAEVRTIEQIKRVSAELDAETSRAPEPDGRRSILPFA